MRTSITQARRSGAFVGLRDLVRPQQLPSLAAWYDISDLSSLRNNAGAVPSSGDSIKLVGDKSGNSAVNALVLNGVAGNYASAPDSPALDIVADIGVWWVGSLNDISPATTAMLATKWTTATENRSYALFIATTGVPGFQWTTLGTFASAVTANATANISTIASDYGRFGIAATLDVDDGAGGYVVTFYSSTDGGATWSAFGDPVVGVGTTSIFSGTANLNIGANTDGTGSLMVGLTNRAFIRNSTATSGATVFDADFSTAAKLATSFTESSVNAATVTINTSGATGARISGARDLYQGTAANQPVYLPWSGTNYGYLNGAAGNYFSTPDSAAVSITGDIEIQGYIAANDYTPATDNTIAAKFIGGQASYELYFISTGVLRFTYYDGSSVITASSTVALSTVVSDMSGIWVRSKLDVDAGGGNHTVRFDYSADGVSWTQLGTTITAAGTNPINDGTAVLAVGSQSDGTTAMFSGKIFRVKIYSGFSDSGGTLVFDFNPSAYTSGTTFLDSAGGATITLNGGATIVTRTCLYFDSINDYLKSPAFALAQPVSIYGALSQLTWTSNDGIYDGNAAFSMLLFQNGAGTPDLRINAGANAATNSGLALSTNAVVTAVFNAASSLDRINRLAAVTGNPGTAAPNGFALGAKGDGTAPANITVSELLVYAAAHGRSFQDRVIMWLGRFWGITV